MFIQTQAGSVPFIGTMHLGDFYNSPNYIFVEFLQMFMFGLMYVGRTLQVLFFKEAS